MAVSEIKDNVRLKLELLAGMKGDEEVLKSKTLSKVKPIAENEDLYEVAKSLASLQQLPLSNVKRLEEILLIEE